MKKKNTSRRLPSEAILKKTQQYSVLSKAISLVAKSGPSKLEVNRLIALAIKNTDFARGKTNTWLTGSFQTITVAITVLQAWHRHRSLIDDSANPLPISLLGSGQSVESIIRGDHPQCNAASVAKEIYKLGFIEKVGKNKYLPVDIKAYILGDHPLYLLRVMFLAIKFFETVEHNFSAKTDAERLPERAAHIESFPKAKLPAFIDISRQQSAALIALIDNWMESNRQAQSSSKKKAAIVEAGLHVFAYATKPAS